MKLLASDFDQTLWFEDHMKDKDVKAIHHFQKQGYLFGICSGRSLSGVLKYSKLYDLHLDFYILLSGGLILNKDFEVLLKSQIPLDLIKEIYAFTNQQDITVVVDDVTYFLTHHPQEKVFGHLIHSLDEIPQSYVQAFSFHYQESEISLAQHMTAQILKKYGHDIEAFQNNQHIDLTMKGCSKGKGIKMIQDYFHLSDDEIYGIGDNYNDLPMFEAIQHSYSFDYAPIEVQKKAEKIVSQLYECIENILK